MSLLIARRGLVAAGAALAAPDPGGFSPDDVAGLHLWYDAKAISGLSDNDPISQWDDESGNSRHATQATGANQPLYRTAGLNSLPTVQFDGANHRLDLPDLSSLTAGEVFIVVQVDADPPATGDKTALWYIRNSSSVDSTHYPFTDGNVYDSFGSTARKSVGDPGAALTTARLYNVITVSGEWTARLDGSQIFTTGTNTVGFNSDPRLGWSRSPSVSVFWLDGNVSEMILYNQKVSTSDRASLDAYLSDKWSLTF